MASYFEPFRKSDKTSTFNFPQKRYLGVIGTVEGTCVKSQCNFGTNVFGAGIQNHLNVSLLYLVLDQGASETKLSNS